MLNNNEKVEISLKPSGGQVSQTPTPTAPLEPSGGQVSQTPTPTTQQASYYNPEKEIDKLYKWLYGIVVAAVIAFFFILFDFIKEKEVIINYGSLADKYFDRYIELNNSFYNLDKEFIKKDQKIMELENENTKLSEKINCLESKRYWQFEECFR